MNKVFITLSVYFALLAAACAQTAPQPMSEQEWELTYSVIKSKVQTLIDENSRLMSEYKSLLVQQRKLQQAIAEQKQKNEEIKTYLKERGTKTDEQLEIARLEEALRAKKSELARREQESVVLKARAAAWQYKVDAKQMQISNWEFREQNAKSSPAPVRKRMDVDDGHMDGLRRSLEAQKVQEAALEKELSTLTVQMVDPEIKQLQERVDELKAQKEKMLNQVRPPVPPPAGQLKYMTLMSQKEELEKKIRGLEKRVAGLKQSLVSGFSWAAEKKELIHEIVEADAENNKLREKVNNLRQDIGLLQEQVNRLEIGKSFRVER